MIPLPQVDYPLPSARAQLYARLLGTLRVAPAVEAATAMSGFPPSLTGIGTWMGGGGRQGQTTLFFAAEVGRTAIVRYLLEHGAQVALVDDMGRTPIDAAKGNEGGRSEAGSQEIVALLERVRAAGR